MDFYRIIRTEPDKKGEVKVFPDFRPRDFKDLMVRGGSFYAIWNEEKGMWSTDEYDAVRLVDADVDHFVNHVDNPGGKVVQMRMDSFSSKIWLQFKSFMKNIADSYHELDENLTFANQEVTKKDHVSKRLPYALAPGDISAWDELVGTLYSAEERKKIEWAIGAVVSGESKKLQKFLVFYGSAGTGKSTILGIIEKLFDGYTASFDAKALGSNNSAFSTEAFRSNPLVAIQHDGDLSRIEDNTKLNSIIAHEEITINEKFKGTYPMKIRSMLFMGTNNPVRITDAKSGILRRLIDVHPTGQLIPAERYNMLMEKIDFELGAIAQHCLDVFTDLGRNYYGAYRPVEMMVQTDYFYNFVQSSYDIFIEQGGISKEQAWNLFKEFCLSENIETKMPKFKFAEELKNYFTSYEHRAKDANGNWVWNWYSGFDTSKFVQHKIIEDAPEPLMLEFLHEESILDKMLADCPAQGSKKDKFGADIPQYRWDGLKTTLTDIDTRELHYVKPPINHIVIDFDLKDADGNKSMERNLAAASKWPATYGELSRGGGGVHLHYLYDGDPTLLDPNHDDGIEVKVFAGGSSLRRKLSKCNNLPVANINSGLKLKEEKKAVLSDQSMKDEKSVRALIARNLAKEILPGTKVSIDFIEKILDDAYRSGIPYNVEDMKPDIIGFALKASNQRDRCLETISRMKFHSETEMEVTEREAKDDRIVFYDVEVYPNLFVICWKFRGQRRDQIVRMINPTADEVIALAKYKLVGFFNRGYDNHIIYAAMLGYTVEALYALSQKLISNTGRGGTFGEAYNLSYADIYDFSSIKMSLKKFQVALGIHHQEMDIPWDQPVPLERIEDVCDYCCNDVESTEAVFEDRYQDFVARQVLAELSGLTVNHTTQQHTAKIIFGDDRNPQDQFVYTDLSKMFPGYKYELGKSYYRGEIVGEGGYVDSEPGIYEDVALLDVASMHPTSIECLNLFGKEYTKRFSELKQARIAIKHKDFESAKKMLGGKLAPYLGDPKDSEALSYALKIVINIVYGLTSASFDNKFRDRRNKDNIVAKRGALFMIDLKHFVREQGFQVAHIKTDSIKIPGATPEIIEKVKEFGKKYGYDFEHEATYAKFCLVNDAVYIAKYGWAEKESKIGTWDAVGAQFQHPVVYKTLFSKEDVTFDDQCEARSVAKGVMYLDFQVDAVDKPENPEHHEMRFVGKTGRFVPVKENTHGGILYRWAEAKPGEQKFYAVTGTKGYLWREADQVTDENDIDEAYFQKMVNDAIKTIEKFGSYEELVS